MRRTRLVLVSITLCTGCASMPRAERSAITAIRAARARYAVAWNAADTVGLTRAWMAGFQLTQDQGIHWTAAELVQQVRELRVHYAGPHREWRPRRVRVFLPARLAVEEGEYSVEYVGQHSATPSSWIHGVYTAQWYLSPAGWLLNAEIETPLTCTGAPLRVCTGG